MTLSESQRIAVKEAYATYFKTPTHAQKDAAKALLQDPLASATAVLIAAQHLLGPTFIVYEPETIWLELNPCSINRDKLMAAIALSMTPSFYWDYRVFGATTHALTDEMVVPFEVPKCDAGQMAWAAFEAELLFTLTDGESTQPEYDPSVEAYVAVSLFEAGFVIPPTGLGFAAAELERLLSPDALNLRKETETAWAALSKERFEQHKFEDTALGAQLAKLATSWVYVAEKTKLLRSALGKL
jgi:hypothetical protein